MANALEELKDKLRDLRAGFEGSLKGADDAAALQAVRDRFLGRKSGALTALLKSLGGLPPEARRERELSSTS